MKKVSFLYLAFIALASCNYFSPKPACETQEVVENPLGIDNQQLLQEKLLSKTPEDYRYFFKTFVDESDKTYMITNFRDGKSCFDIKILVNKWDKLGQMYKVNGKAYPKELYNLKWVIRQIDNTKEVLYVDMNRIID